MNGLRFLVIFILLTVGTSGEEDETREGRGGWSTNHRKPNNFRRRQNVKKPMSFGGHNKFNNGKIRVIKLSPPAPSADTESEHLQHLEAPQAISSPPSPSWRDVPVQVTNHGNNGNIGENPSPSFGSSPTIIISDDGDVSFGRSINFNKLKSFHDEYFEHNHDHDHITEEDSDHSSKSLRTVRSAPNRIPGRPELLGATLGGLQQGNLEGLQTISTSQGGQAWNNGDVYGSGGEIVLASSGESNVEGAGTMTSAGVVSVTSSGESSTGWRSRSPSGDTQTFQGVNTGSGAHASDYLDATVSGLAASVTNSGSTSTTGSGTVYTSGTTTNVVNQGGSSGGWRAVSGTGTGTYSGANLGNSGAAGATGSGSISLSGNTNVVSSGGGGSGSGSGWKP